MNDHLDPEKRKIPAFMRKKAIVRQSRQKLILTALDRKQAGLDVHSARALAPMKAAKTVREKTYSNISHLAKKPIIKKMRQTSFPASNNPRNNFFGNEVQSSFENPFSPDPLVEAVQPARRSTASQAFRQTLQRTHQTSDHHSEQPQYEAVAGHAEIHPIGHITAYLEKIQVAIIKLEKPLREGDLIQITADKMLFQQPVESMQLNRKAIKLAKKGAEIGLKVSMEPQLNGAVYKVQI